MSVLELERVSKDHPGRSIDCGAQHALLREVSFDIDAGEVVGIWGLPGSGRTTLLRIAAGLEMPDAGAVRMRGTDIARAQGDVDGLVYCDLTAFSRRAQRVGGTWGSVMEELLTTQLARGVAAAEARDRARAALARTGAERLAGARVHNLDGAAATRVALARALTSDPALLIVDEPTRYVDLLQRDAILTLLRSLAEDGRAVLMTIGESTGFYCVDRALTLSAGRLRGKTVPALAPVVELVRSHSA